jgi:hypothetical protein
MPGRLARNEQTASLSRACCFRAVCALLFGRFRCLGVVKQCAGVYTEEYIPMQEPHMLTEEDINNQQLLIATWRKTLSFLLAQRNRIGIEYVPPMVLHSIRDARQNIASIKALLRSEHISIDDMPEDEEQSFSILGSPTPEDEERASLREILRAHRRRLRVLQLQQASKGSNTPAEIITEIEDIERELNRVEARLEKISPIIALERGALRQRRGEALAAFYAKQWDQAELLLEQVVRTDTTDEEALNKLKQVRSQLEVQAAYQAMRRLRDEGLWQATLDALDELAREHPNLRDPDGLRDWAEYRKQRSERYAVVAVSLEKVIAVDQSDDMARAMLAQARQAHDEGR